MLQSIRDKTSGWIAYLIIGLISVPFALWGINSYLGGGEQQPAAIVNGVEITPRQLDFAYARYRDQLSSVFGGSIPAALDNETRLKEQVLSQIIEEQVLVSYVQNSGYRVGDQKLFENIQSMPVFQQDGSFSKELYRNQLSSQGYQPALFEQELRQSSEMEQLSLAIKSTAFVLPVQIDSYNNLHNQSRKIRSLTVANQTDSITVSDQEISDFYAEQSGLYMNPAMVKIDYIELGLDNVKISIEVTEDQVLQRYEQMRDQLTTAEMRIASHILLTVDSDASSEQDEQAREKIDGLKARIDQGADFAELAKEFSQDPGSAVDGGDLGEVERGMMVKPFETILFALNVGDVSEPVKTQFGWHLIKLHEISGGDTQTFEQARVEIEQEVKTELAESQIYDLAENLANIGYEQPDSILPASEQLDLKIQTTDWFSRSQGTGLAELEKFRQIAFSTDVLKQNRNSETIELSDNRIIIMHLNSHKPAEKQPLETVRALIIDAIKKKAGREKALSSGKELLSELKQGASLDSVADKSSLTVFDAGYVGRSSDSLDRDVLNTAFTLVKPVNNNPVFEGVSEVDGDYTIIEFSDLRVDKDRAAESTNNNIIKTLNDSSADYEFQALLKSLTEAADIIRTPVTELQ